MEFLLSDDRPLSRGEVLAALEQCLPKILGPSVEVRAPSFLDNRLADMFAHDDRGTIYAVRWIDPRELGSKFFELLRDYHELNVTRRAALEAFLGIEDPSSGDPIRLILAASVIRDSWLDATATLAIPLEFLRVHALRREGTASPLYFFERRSAGATAPADGPGPHARAEMSAIPNEFSDSPLEPAELFEPIEEDAPIDAGLSIEKIVPDPPAIDPSFGSAPQSSGPSDDLFEGLSEEERRSFQILQTILDRAAR